MKKFLFIAILSTIGSIMGLNAQIELRTPTQENKNILKKLITKAEILQYSRFFA